ncbi:winged helix-turn-helix domain-containing protein [Halorhodospira halophila]|uniref:Response regulator receiver protein n=1 Tax=Halorhodospira halophila (strain DSM 244 / SL1) TaxID=349124 RepID=A1WWM5_HALHL|nr:winged helix-turn-helix domain-containing protein [Halorhodospira halophila]ABM62087.1 response regulator receiver protein [Halorhodospira halophila SL1]MBK1729415.1 winged helix family transcriptional regulator [Halorhodospira halophila]
MNNGCFETLLASVPRLTSGQRQALLRALMSETAAGGPDPVSTCGDGGAAHSGPAESLSVRGLVIDPARHEARVEGRAVELSRTQFRLLHFLAAHRHRVVTRDELIRGVWGPRAYLESRTVDAHVRRLRQALRPAGYDRMIRTVRGVGYHLDSSRAEKEAA